MKSHPYPLAEKDYPKCQACNLPIDPIEHHDGNRVIELLWLDYGGVNYHYHCFHDEKRREAIVARTANRLCNDLEISQLTRVQKAMTVIRITKAVTKFPSGTLHMDEATITEALTEALNKLKQQKKAEMPQVYIIQEEPPTGPIKIGYTSSDPAFERDRLQVGNPRELQLHTQFEGGPAQEDYLHTRLRPYHIKGEWYRVDEHILQYLDLAVPYLEDKARLAKTQLALADWLKHDYAKDLTPEQSFDVLAEEYKEAFKKAHTSRRALAEFEARYDWVGEGVEK